MCGICGIIDHAQPTQAKENVLQAMNQTLACRGPDQSGLWQDEHCSLAHRRLIVIDPEYGIQPMTRQIGDRKATIVYNGELYNMDTLREKLLAKGLPILTRSDTELVLCSYLAWQEDCVDQLDGIFAFAIWDHNRKLLFAARDRLGVKPFFYYHKEDFLVFASEPKAILTHDQVPRSIDATGLCELLGMGPSRSPGHAIFYGIQDLKPGHSLLFQDGHCKEFRYYQLTSHTHEQDYPTTVSKVRELVEDAVTRQLVADVPVGCLLSGGLDSSIISAIAAKVMTDRSRQLATFSVDFVDEERYFLANRFQTSRDAPYAKEVAAYLSTHHQEILVEPLTLAQNYRIPLQARDLPGMADIDTSLYLFSQQIKQHVTVALSGEGADEIFGGYPWFYREDLVNVNTFPWSRHLSERLRIFHPALRDTLQIPSYVAARYEEALAEVPVLQGESPTEARQRIMTYLNITRFLVTLLERKDRMSMATGLEIRVPFCDHTLVDYVFNIPFAMKFQQDTPKQVLRDAVRDLLPESIVKRRKTPYPSPHHPHYSEELAKNFEQLLHEDTSPLLPLLDPTYAKQRLDESREHKEHDPWFGQIMGTAQMFDYLLQIDAWLRHYRITIM